MAYAPGSIPNLLLAYVSKQLRSQGFEDWIVRRMVKDVKLATPFVADPTMAERFYSGLNYDCTTGVSHKLLAGTGHVFCWRCGSCNKPSHAQPGRAGDAGNKYLARRAECKHRRQHGNEHSAQQATEPS